MKFYWFILLDYKYNEIKNFASRGDLARDWSFMATLKEKAKQKDQDWTTSSQTGIAKKKETAKVCLPHIKEFEEIINNNDPQYVNLISLMLQNEAIETLDFIKENIENELRRLNHGDKIILGDDIDYISKKVKDYYIEKKHVIDIGRELGYKIADSQKNKEYEGYYKKFYNDFLKDKFDAVDKFKEKPRYEGFDIHLKEYGIEDLYGYIAKCYGKRGTTFEDYKDVPCAELIRRAEEYYSKNKNESKGAASKAHSDEVLYTNIKIIFATEESRKEYDQYLKDKKSIKLYRDFKQIAGAKGNAFSESRIVQMVFKDILLPLARLPENEEIIKVIKTERGVSDDEACLEFGRKFLYAYCVEKGTANTLNLDAVRNDPLGEERRKRDEERRKQREQQQKEQERQQNELKKLRQQEQQKEDEIKKLNQQLDKQKELEEKLKRHTGRQKFIMGAGALLLVALIGVSYMLFNTTTKADVVLLLKTDESAGQSETAAKTPQTTNSNTQGASAAAKNASGASQTNTPQTKPKDSAKKNAAKNDGKKEQAAPAQKSSTTNAGAKGASQPEKKATASSKPVAPPNNKPTAKQKPQPKKETPQKTTIKQQADDQSPPRRPGF